MRCTLDTDTPLAFAMPRELQCVAFWGTLSKVVTITASMRVSSIVRGAPERGSSRKPSTRCSSKTSAPFADRRAVQAQPDGHIFVLRAFRAGQHDPSPKRERLRRLAATR